jgi:hypothetical protein
MHHCDTLGAMVEIGSRADKERGRGFKKLQAANL